MNISFGIGRKKLIENIIKHHWGDIDPEQKQYLFAEMLFIIQEMMLEEGKPYQDGSKNIGHEVFREFIKMLIARNVANYDSMVLLTGSKGTGKCVLENSNISTKRGIVQAKDLMIGDILFDEDGNETVVRNKWHTVKECLSIKTDFGGTVVVSKDHRLKTVSGLVESKDLLVDDYVNISSRHITIDGDINDYERAFVFGAYLADGHGQFKKRKDSSSYCITISNNDINFLDAVSIFMRRRFHFLNIVIRKASGDGRFVLVGYGKDEVAKFIELCGRISAEKKIPEEVFKSKEGVRGFLDGYCNGDMTCNYNKNDIGKYKIEMGWMMKSEMLALGFLDALHIEGFYPLTSVRTLQSGKWKGNEYYRLHMPAKTITQFLESRHFVNLNKIERVANVLKIRKERSVGTSIYTMKGNNILTTDKCILTIGDRKYTRINSITSVGVEKCVDIEVSGESHLFQFAGGIVSHNSSAAIMLAREWCKQLGIRFDPDKMIAYNNADLVEKIENSPKFYPIIADESVRFASAAEWARRENKELKKKLAQIRTRHLFFILCFPLKIDRLENSYLQSFTNYWIDIYTRGKGCIFIKNNNPMDDAWSLKQFLKLGSYNEFTSPTHVEKVLSKHSNFWKTISFPKPPSWLYDKYLLVREKNVYDAEEVLSTVTKEDIVSALLLLALNDIMTNDLTLKMNRIILHIKKEYDISLTPSQVERQISDAKQILAKLKQKTLLFDDESYLKKPEPKPEEVVDKSDDEE